jgi:hypothetical protein
VEPRGNWALAADARKLELKRADKVGMGWDVGGGARWGWGWEMVRAI